MHHIRGQAWLGHPYAMPASESYSGSSPRERVGVQGKLRTTNPGHKSFAASGSQACRALYCDVCQIQAQTWLTHWVNASLPVKLCSRTPRRSLHTSGGSGHASAPARSQAFLFTIGLEARVLERWPRAPTTPLEVLLSRWVFLVEAIITIVRVADADRIRWALFS